MNSDHIENILCRIQNCIERNTFDDVETEKVELKDLSTGNNWISLKQTICAFLNTDGGIIICGIREKEKDKKYTFTGFRRDNENKLKGIVQEDKEFKDDKDNAIPYLSHYISFEYVRFMDGEVAIIRVKQLEEDKKYIKYNNVYCLVLIEVDTQKACLWKKISNRAKEAQRLNTSFL